MSQRMTFLYLPRLGNWSSWPVTKPTASISKAWRPGGMPNLDRTIAPTMDAGGYGSVSARMRSESALTHESLTTLALAETSALDCVWHIVPFIDESALS